MARDDTLKLGTFVYTFGFHPAAWLHPGSDVKGANDISHLAKVAKISEAAKLDFMFFADSPAAAVGQVQQAQEECREEEEEVGEEVLCLELCEKDGIAGPAHTQRLCA